MNEIEFKLLDEFDNQFNVEKRCDTSYFPTNYTAFVLFNKARDHDIKAFVLQALQEQREEILGCLPERRKLTAPFNLQRDYEVMGHNDCREQFLNNLKDANLI